MSTRYRLTVAYLGTGLCGWQRQPSAPTVQAELEGALQSATGAAGATVVGAGRTDAGVHAAAQVAHVDLPSPIPADGLRAALNGALPDPIRIIRAAAAPPSFHARFNAKGKRYCYRGRWSRSPVQAPWLELRRARVRSFRDSDATSRCVAGLVGTQDWASFTVTNPETKSTVRTIFEARLDLEPHGFRVEIIGDGFLRYQVRRIVGALLEVGWGNRDDSWFRRLLSTPHPGAAMLTAPARGLTLEHVYYRTPAAGRKP
jgi:tRNA pseudouridine38-40 synthase